MAISFQEGIRRYRRAYAERGIVAEDFLEEARDDLIIAQLENMRDDPQGPLWRDRKDEGPVRIVTGKLAWSLIGDNPSGRVREHLPATSRRWGLDKAGGTSRNIREIREGRNMRTLVHGTRVGYGIDLEYGFQFGGKDFSFFRKNNAPKRALMRTRRRMRMMLHEYFVHQLNKN